MDEHLFTDLDAILREAERLAAHTGARGAETEDPSPLHEQRAQQPPTPIIVYLVDPPSPEVNDDVERSYDPEHAVESLPQTEEEVAATPPADVEQETEVPLSPAPPKARRHTNQQGILVSVLCLFLAAAALTAFLLTRFTASATVTIIPVSRQISASTTFTLVTTGAPNPLHHELAGRVLSALTLSQAQNVQTTGRGHEAAQAAHGWITFYNAAPFSQTIAAGTLLTGEDGVEVVIGADAVIPAVTYPTLGEVQVPAQAVIAGPAGNIQAGDIYGPCCRLNVSAVNQAFHGGQEARSYPMVSQADWNGATTSLKAGLLHSVEAAFAAQVQPGESMLTPRCTPSITANHAVGEEATQLRVTLDETCTALAYRTQALHDLLTQVLTQEATGHLAAGSHLSGEVQASVRENSSSGQPSGRITLQVQGRGTWSYQFDETALEQLAGHIAGKSTSEARTIVLGVPGVQSVSIQLSGGVGTSSTLPANPAQIRMEQLLGFGL